MKLYKTSLVTHVYFTVPDNADTRAIERAGYDAIRDALRDSSPHDADAPREVKAGECIEDGWDADALVYGSHGSDLTLGDALNAIPGHRAVIDAFKARFSKAAGE